ncbi:uroporphyrinogen-III synthase [Sphingomicrobium marinum]|uniref:uroporphyrinogen-III synthase n=1 Tax=Sphingomicrobium marinum TaxID=1227950 RepID=UPI00223EDD1E|nr:uroporphyrinogen-III synthase [Sphingomicrobium marinum]
MRPLVILRPEPGASLSADRAEKMGFETVICASLFKVRPVEWQAPDPDRFDGLLITSANAVRAAGDQLQELRSLPVHTVGEATASAARSAGLMVETVGDDGIDELLGMLPEDLRLLHLGGRHRRTPAEPRQTLVPVTVYSSVAREDPKNFERIASAVACVHSPRAGARLAELADRDGIDRTQIAIAAISQNAADACGDGWECIKISGARDDASLLALALQLCKSSDDA